MLRQHKKHRLHYGVSSGCKRVSQILFFVCQLQEPTPATHPPKEKAPRERGFGIKLNYYFIDLIIPVDQFIRPEATMLFVQAFFGTLALFCKRFSYLHGFSC
jgi:hypothetical protein